MDYARGDRDIDVQDGATGRAAILTEGERRGATCAGNAWQDPQRSWRRQHMGREFRAFLAR